MPLTRKVAYIDLSTGEVTIDMVPDEIRRAYLGGRGINTFFLHELIKPGIDPLGPDNYLIFGAGLLTGLSSGRCNVSAKSPETGYLGDSNFGGDFGAALVGAGFSHLVIRGQSPKPVFLWVHNGIVEIRDAFFLMGQDTLTTQKLIRDNLQVDAKVACIGIAGENLVRWASVNTGNKNMAGRTGMGAVMGSKNLKAVAASGSEPINLKEPKKFLEAVAESNNQILATRWAKTMGELGTPFLISFSNKMGYLSVRHHQDTSWGDAIAPLEADNLKKYGTGMVSCFGCAVHCRHRHLVENSRYGRIQGEGPEYAATNFCSTVGSTDLELALYVNQILNRYGMDFISTGSYLGWMMELYEKGVIDESITGIPLKWGDPDAIIGLINMVAKREGFGDMLAEGRHVAKHLPPAAEGTFMHIKQLPMEPTDERTVKSFALGMATATRGGCHMRSRPSINITNVPTERLSDLYGGLVTDDIRSYVGKGRMIWWHECFDALVDSLGYCRFLTLFTTIHGIQYHNFTKLIEYSTGMALNEAELHEVGERVYTTEKMYLVREGLKRAEDTLPKIYFEQPVPKGPAKGEYIERNEFNKMLDENYGLHGWDKQGVPSQETLKRLKLDKLLRGWA